MKYTTIAVKEDLKERIKEFGSKKESYSDIIEKLLKSAIERQLHDILLNEDDPITIDEALDNARKEWQG